MAAPEMHLVGGTGVIGATGEIPDEQSKDERIVELEEVVDLLEKDLRKHRSQIKRLMNEAEAKREKAAKSDVVERVFEAWQQASGHTRSILGPKRFDTIYARLQEGFSEAQLTMAAIGIGLHPSVIEGKRFDDIELACRDEIRVERFANLCPAERRREITGSLFTEVAA